MPGSMSSSGSGILSLNEENKKTHKGWSAFELSDETLFPFSPESDGIVAVDIYPNSSSTSYLYIKEYDEDGNPTVDTTSQYGVACISGTKGTFTFPVRKGYSYKISSRTNIARATTTLAMF